MKLKRIVTVVVCSLLIWGTFIIFQQENNKDEKPPVVSEEEEILQEDTRVSFVGVGDDLIHGAIYADAYQSDGSYDFTSMYENVVPYTTASDIAFINQETMLGGKQFGVSSYPMFSSPTEIAENLQRSGFNVANLATNHSLDIGYNGIVATKEAFANTDIVVDGIYEDEDEFNKIVVFEKNGIQFSLLSYTYGTNGLVPEYDFELSYLDDEQIRRDVEEAKKLSDVVMVSAHWGEENVFTVTPEQEHYAQLFTELGVDVVIGTHPHVIQPVEWKENAEGHQTLIVYSLGNFIGAMASVDNMIGGFIGFDFVKDGETGVITIENVKWKTVVTHYERVYPDSLDGSRNFKVYFLEEYTDEFMSRHALNGYAGQVVSREYIQSVVDSVIDSEYLK